MHFSCEWLRSDMKQHSVMVFNSTVLRLSAYYRVQRGHGSISVYIHLYILYIELDSHYHSDVYPKH